MSDERRLDRCGLSGLRGTCATGPVVNDELGAGRFRTTVAPLSRGAAPDGEPGKVNHVPLDSPAAKATAVSRMFDLFKDTVAIYFSGAMGVPFRVRPGPYMAY